MALIRFARIMLRNNVINRSRLTSTSGFSSKSEDLDDKPISYTKSPAMQWQARYSFGGKQTLVDRPKHEGSIIIGSVMLFLFYFTVLREENDIDESFGKSLYETVPGLEKNDLKLALRHGTLSNHERQMVQARLQELEKDT